LLIRVARVLSGADLPYMIIGGQAVLLYGTPRLTRDIDVTLGVGVDEMERVLKAVERIGLEIIPEDFEAFVKKTFVLPAKDSSTGIRIDLIFSFSLYEKQAIERAQPVFFDDTAVMFASLEDVIIHKIFAGRARDMEDVATIMVKNPGYDRDYIQKWLKEFDRSMETNEFSGRFQEISRQAGGI
ncbi:MAG: nucleotidyl transferase AbiEii/AbiGii toxin family protein, partial [Deltaproteobacteria bacterium]|nr:nucleotidyl transferase AbiEii/AbiGii toxin family protein [Deltaproteobacteria bacterium]